MGSAGNFAFLGVYDKRLVTLGGLAERYFRDDQSTAIVKLRQLAELTAKIIAAQHGAYRDERETFEETLRRLAYDRIIPREVADIFHALRKFGNVAVHEAKGRHDNALTALKFARSLGVWFHRTYGEEPNFNPGPFVPPPEPDAPIIYGILQPGPDQADGVPYVRPTEIVDDAIHVSALRRTTHEIAGRYGRSSLKPGDVLLSIVGTIGNVAIVPAELAGGNITQSSYRVRARRTAPSTQFVSHFLRSPSALSQFDEARLGTAVPRLNLEDVRKIEVPLLPLPEQRRIVAKIDSLAGKSRRARDHLDHIPRLTAKYKQSVLAAAFRGDLTREWRAERGVTTLYRTALIADVTAEIRYGTAKKCNYGGGATPVLRIPNVQRGEITLDDLKSADLLRNCGNCSCERATF